MPRGTFDNTHGTGKPTSEPVDDWNTPATEPVARTAHTGSPGTPEQQAIWDALLNDTRHVICEAVAGSGKTYTIVEYAKQERRDKQVGLVAFNRHIAQELRDRMGQRSNVECATYHSLGYRAVRNSVRGRCEVDRYKVLSLLDSFRLAVRKQDEKTIKYRVASLVSYCKSFGFGPDTADREQLEFLTDRFDLDLGTYSSVIYDTVPKVLQKCMDELRTVDYDDQVWLPMILGLPVPKYDVLCVDEYQDTGLTQQWLAIHAAKRLCAVGDPHQCHPAGTLVEMTGGEVKPIETVAVGDSVVTYHSGTSTFRGLLTQGRQVEAVHKESYSGYLYKLQAGDKEVLCTPNHRWLVRMNHDRDEDYWVLYLMTRGEKARVGLCRGKYREQTGPMQRARTEKADRLWLLQGFDTLAEARAAELIAQSQFGLPSLIFEQNLNPAPTQEFIEEVYSSLGNLLGRAEQCLNWYGRSIDTPVWTPESVGRVSVYSFITEACNILSGFMQVRLFDNDAHGGYWRTVRVGRRKFKGEVYGIQVQPTEGGRRLYVANGIVSHNSIYSFRGADSRGFDRLREKLGSQVITLPLTLTRRCPKSHVSLAQQIVPQIRALDDAPDGVVRVVSDVDKATEEMRAGDLVVCRVNAELVGTAYKLLKRGVRAIVRGRDIGEGLRKLVEQAEQDATKALGHLAYMVLPREIIQCAGDITTQQVLKFSSMPHGKGEMRAQNAQDRYDCLVTLASQATSVRELKDTIAGLFEDDVQGVQAVVLGTVHRTKGLEGNRVYILRPDLIPHPMARKAEDQEGERNLGYVAVTRAKFDKDTDKPGELVFVGDISPMFHNRAAALGLLVPAGKPVESKIDLDKLTGECDTRPSTILEDPDQNEEPAGLDDILSGIEPDNGVPEHRRWKN